MVQFGTGTRCKKLKVRNFWGLIPMFVEVAVEKLDHLPILNSVNNIINDSIKIVLFFYTAISIVNGN